MTEEQTTQQTEANASNPADVYAAAVGKLVRLHNTMIFAVFVISLGCLAFTQWRGGGIDLSTIQWRILLVIRILLPILALVVTTIYTSKGMDHAVEQRFSNNQIFNLYQRIRLLSMGLLSIAGIVAGLSLIAGNLGWDLLLLIVTFLLLVITRPSLVGFVYIVRAIEEQAREEAGAD